MKPAKSSRRHSSVNIRTASEPEAAGPGNADGFAARGTKMKKNSHKIAGGFLTHGALIRDPKLAPSLYGAAHGNMARAGAPKRLTSPAPAYGQKRQTAGPLHPFLHGQAVNDETAGKLCHGKSSAIHNGIGSESPEHRGADYGLDHGSTILQRGGTLALDKHGDVRPGQLPNPATKRNAG
jgi:hypothetical protein